LASADAGLRPICTQLCMRPWTPAQARTERPERSNSLVRYLRHQSLREANVTVARWGERRGQPGAFLRSKVSTWLGRRSS
jgi:hypothetical protein